VQSNNFGYFIFNMQLVFNTNFNNILDTWWRSILLVEENWCIKSWRVEIFSVGF